MKTWRHHLPSSRAIILLLVVAVFFLTVFQTHVHIHSADAHDSHHSHAHVSDVHLFDNQTDQNHHDTAKVIEAKPAGIIKKQLEEDILPILAIVLFSLLFVCLRRRVGFSKPVDIAVHHRSRFRYFIPLLRAPPQY